MLTNILQSKYQASTKNLIQLVNKDSNLKFLLINSIEKAKIVNPDVNTNPVRNLIQYYNYIDHAVRSFPAVLEASQSSASFFTQIEQSIVYFYFLNDQPLEELKKYHYFRPSLQYHEPYRSWLITFVKQWGKFLDTKKSWNSAYLNKLVEDDTFRLKKSWYENSKNWKSFNQFFSRRLRTPAIRPISAQEDESIVVSPCDSVPQGIWKIDQQSQIILGNDFYIKSKKFSSISNLLGPQSLYKDAFASGTLFHAFLNLHDYHRYHFPMDGIIKEIYKIDASTGSGGIISWNTTSQKYVLDYKIPQWQSLETRGVAVLKTHQYGLVALLPVGMCQVNSVNFEKNLKIGQTVKKGSPFGYFLFGGSNFVMIFQKGINLNLTQLKNLKNTYEHMLMGEELGSLNKVV